MRFMLPVTARTTKRTTIASLEEYNLYMQARQDACVAYCKDNIPPGPRRRPRSGRAIRLRMTQ